jgi:predicted glycosyl hydrolase (DUF1957 family)
MTDRQILDEVQRWLKAAIKLDKNKESRQRLKEIQQLIDSERAKKNEAGGGWL